MACLEGAGGGDARAVSREVARPSLAAGSSAVVRIPLDRRFIRTVASASGKSDGAPNLPSWSRRISPRRTPRGPGTDEHFNLKPKDVRDPIPEDAEVYDFRFERLEEYCGGVARPDGFEGTASAHCGVQDRPALPGDVPPVQAWIQSLEPPSRASGRIRPMGDRLARHDNRPTSPLARLSGNRCAHKRASTAILDGGYPSRASCAGRGRATHDPSLSAGEPPAGSSPRRQFPAPRDDRSSLALGWIITEAEAWLRPRDVWDVLLFRLTRPDLASASYLELVWAVLTVGVLSGTAQELFYRGFMQTRLSGAWGPAPAILVTNLCFAVTHYRLDALEAYLYGVLPISSPLSGPPLGVWDLRWFLPVATSFMIGLYFGYLTELTGSVVPAMAGHIVWNASTQLGTLQALSWRPSRGEMIVGSILVFVFAVWYLREAYRKPDNTAHAADAMR